MRQVHYLFHVITMPGEHRCLYKVLWPPRICSCMLGAIDPLLLPCITEEETESWSSVLRLQSKQRAKFLNSQLDTHLASPQVCVMVWGLRGCDILPRVTVSTLHSDFDRALYQAGALPRASRSALAD